jgi:multicomponent Na+:H+ antiporter subunit B
MYDKIILRTVVKILVPFIFMFGLYVQFHGEYSPGGGFQAGVICAVAYISYGLISGMDELTGILSVFILRLLASIGVLIYATVGIVTMILGGNFLEYSYLSASPVVGQQIGIIIIELGVGITVFAVMMLIFYMFAKRSE